MTLGGCPAPNVESDSHMSYRPRWYLPGTVYEVTNRTIQERFLLQPSETSRDLLVGILAKAAMYCPCVLVHAFVFLSNHCHLMISSTRPEQIPEFLRFVFGNASREMGRLHGWRGPLWARPCTVIPILDEDAQINRLRYLLQNGVKEGLVRSPLDWPGATSTHALLADMTLEGRWIERDRMRRAFRWWRRTKPTDAMFTTNVQLRLSPLPCWQSLSPAELRSRHQTLVASVEHQGTFRRELYLGVTKVLAVHPHDRPRTSKHEAAPWCHASSLRMLGLFHGLYRDFVDAFRRASSRICRWPQTELPRGSFLRPPIYGGDGTSLEVLTMTA